ncbi:DNA-3-methyladenine glycosylase family protein [Virgibacillus halodenitrificans]|jgi:DNA-3-methyladenine glycosylase II|uniref:DNA-3-methyladenine glycosylase family protein n=1 Tax=Virgibacillus halodenitrificans TaxID=1482 RepID=UPI000EF45BB6|nr:DNA-3-methyladenine glycosylase [Virgibacillus halodenitrificans]
MLLINVDSQEVQYLCKNDRELAKVIQLIGDIQIQTRKNYYSSLVQSIIGQLISVKAANTIRQRVFNACDGEIMPEKIERMDDQSIKKLGFSKQKIASLRDLTERVQNGELPLEELDYLSDKEIMSRLTAIRGIGPWTAEMFLIFSMQRMNILSLADVGLQRAAKWLYGNNETDGKSLLLEKSIQWQPYQTIASFYLWRIIDDDHIRKDKEEVIHPKID